MSEKQLAFVAGELPSPQAYTGRPAYSNRELLPGILKVLRSGCRWRDLNLEDYPDGSTHWRRLRFWKQKGNNFRRLWQLLLRMLRKNKQLKLEILSIDGSLVQSFDFKDKTGYSGKHNRTGTKISTISDGSGIPLGMVVSKGNTHDVALAESTLDAIRIAHGSIQGSTLLADKGYDSKYFRKYTAEFGIVPNIPKKGQT